MKRCRVADKFVRCDAKTMVIGAECHKHKADQWALGEIKRPAEEIGSVFPRFSILCCIHHVRKIQTSPIQQRRVGLDDLSRLSVYRVEGCSPDFVPPNDLRQTMLDDPQIKRAAAIHNDRFNAAVPSAGLHLFPNFLL